MATYLRPGVFVEESLAASTSVSDTADSVAAFVGTCSNGGPLGPTLITSWSQYQALFGSVRGSSDELAFSVYSYFNNGGSQAYIVRAVNDDATPASLTLNDAAAGGGDTAEPTLTITATSPGTWASAAASTGRIFVTIQAAQTTGRFDLTIEVGSGVGLLAREQFIDVTLNPDDSRYAVSLVNSPTIGSKYVTLTKVGTWGDDVTVDTTGNPAVVSKVPLTGGSDGTGSPDLVTAVQRLDNVDNILTVNLPGVADTTVLSNVINWAEAAANRFVVIDVAKPAASDGPTEMITTYTSFVAALPKSSYAAVYGPWIYAADPSSSVNGALRLMAPGGAVCGQYARSDVTRGVQKAPAGTDTGLRVIQVATRFSNTQLDTLNQAHVNVIRSVPGAGFCIMGARTLNTSTPDRYINIRRSLIAIKRGLVNLTRFAAFENNDSVLWELIAAVCDQYLMTQFQIGVLRGDIPAEAYYVRCDEEINDASSVNAGVVQVEIGVALSTPAEFIVIRIGQFEGGSTVEETED